MLHRVIVTDSGGGRRSVRLAGDRLSLGRAGDNAFCYPEATGLSRHHMVLERLGQDWWVRDLGSKNGTLVNDERITGKVRLQPGDRITTSQVTLVYETFEGEEEEQAEGVQHAAGSTVVFDPPDPGGQQPITHTVTLGALLSEEEKALAARLGELGGQWSNPVTALVRAGRELMARKPMKELFREILNLSMEAVGAGRGVLLALEDDQLLVQASRGEEFRISSAVRDRVVNERSSLLISDVRSDEALRQRQSILMEQVRSLMAVPLQTDERVLGLIYVDTPRPWREFTAEQLNLLTVMANVAAIGLERERLAAAERARQMWERELEQAAEIQRQFLPLRVPVVSGLDLAGYNRACRTVGGDYYDFLEYPDGAVLVALGDVAGKGMSAALLMVNVQARMQVLAEHRSPPAALVGQLNRAMTAVCPGNRFITFFLCEIDPASGELTYCNAGHDPPFLIRADGAVRRLEGGGPVLGILSGMTYQQQACRMEPGDTLAVYSDGITEAVNPDGHEFGQERLLDLLIQHRGEPAGELLKTVNRVLDEFVAGAPPADDVTLVVARRTA